LLPDQHLVQSAKYNAEAAEWALEVTNLSTGASQERLCDDFLVELAGG
jgi:hypothetical protein